jgi:hypothetical protein
MKKKLKQILTTIAWIMGAIVIGIAIYGVITTLR